MIMMGKTTTPTLISLELEVLSVPSVVVVGDMVSVEILAVVKVLVENVLEACSTCSSDTSRSDSSNNTTSRSANRIKHTSGSSSCNSYN